MPEKWDKKTLLEYAKELKSPFEEQAGRSRLSQLGDKIRGIIPKREKIAQ